MTPEQQGQVLLRLERQNREIIDLLQQLVRRAGGPAPAGDGPADSRFSRWNREAGYWEMFLQGTGWVQDFNKKAPPPGGAP